MAILQPKHASPLFIVSNRGPASWYRRADGKYIARQSSGGLATSLVSAAAQMPVRWIAVAGQAIERQAFEESAIRVLRIGKVRIHVRAVPVPDRIYKRFYADFSNGVLWFLQHYLFHPDRSPSFGATEQQAWEEGYVAVNRLVADALIAELECLSEEECRDAVVQVQDYHFYLVPAMLRERFPTLAITHFTHIPWPAVRYWQFLPAQMGTQLLQGLLASDVIGFQTPIDVRNFLTCVEGLLPNAEVQQNRARAFVGWQGRLIQVRAYPIGIDPVHIAALSQSQAAQHGFAPIARYFDRQTILRVDRLEPTKNILRGLEAFALLLEQHPEFRERARFVMVLVPSREEVRRYRQYSREVHRLIHRINQQFGSETDPVVVPIWGNDHARALACMRSSEVFIANSILDGMHLGAHEYAEINACDGVLILSRTTGVYQTMGEHAALGVTPTDVQETADALFAALTLPREQRRSIATAARYCAREHTVHDWIHEQLHDIHMQRELNRTW